MTADEMSPEEFAHALTLHKKRPLMLIGYGNTETHKVDAQDWHLLTVYGPLLAGMFDQSIHGIYARFSYGCGWVADQLYIIPSELQCRDEHLHGCALGGGYKTNGMNDADLVAAGAIDTRWKWDDDPACMARSAVREYAATIKAHQEYMQRIRAAVEAK